ncbi:hypothetical protein DASC09_037910 [Saccharomycopsis crataegensis]|uniref:DUF1746 domain-containing protein n=1 Tax=Saccharomycopsis crataegensis TaxID=43959 RepID=A0AAV5QPH1_9ASCO|nr:hypothetical protein DASC09_037910 [Saccharomycopsis crataegensis]
MSVVTVSHFASEKEILTNNRKVLKQRKKHFLQDIRSNLIILSLVSIYYVYLLDASFFFLIGRSIFHFILSSSFQTQGNDILKTARGKKMITRMLFFGPLCFNLYVILIRLFFFKVPSPGHHGYKYSGWTLQLVGERITENKVKILFNDFLIIILQFLIFAAWFLTFIDPTIGSKSNTTTEQSTSNDSSQQSALSVSPSSNQESDNSINTPMLSSIPQDEDVQGDGYSGQLNVITIQVITIIKRVWNISWEEETEEEQTMFEESLNNLLNDRMNTAVV